MGRIRSRLHNWSGVGLYNHQAQVHKELTEPLSVVNLRADSSRPLQQEEVAGQVDSALVHGVGEDQAEDSVVNETARFKDLAKDREQVRETYYCD